MTIPATPCINCQSETLLVTRTEKRFEEGSSPPLWVATTLHVECQACGHRFQLAVIPEA